MVGDSCEVYSKQAGAWIRATVAGVDGVLVTVDYSGRRKTVDMSAEDWPAILRNEHMMSVAKDDDIAVDSRAEFRALLADYESMKAELRCVETVLMAVCPKRVLLCSISH